MKINQKEWSSEQQRNYWIP